MHIFHTYFAIFGQKIFFSKIGLHQSLGAAKSYLDTKNQKILMSRLSGISRTNGRTDEGKSIGPYLIGRSKNSGKHNEGIQICIVILNIIYWGGKKANKIMLYIWKSICITFERAIPLKETLYCLGNLLIKGNTVYLFVYK